MGKTLAEKILSKSIGKELCAGDSVEVNVDLAMGHDGTAVLCIDDFEKLKGKIWDKDKLILVADHFAPPCIVNYADVSKKFFDFVKKNKFQNFYNFSGICHQILAEHQNVVSGKIIIGADSHTVTVGALNCFATGVGATDFLGIMLTGKIWLKVPRSYKIIITGNTPDFISGKDIALEITRLLGEDGAVYKSLEFFDRTKSGISMDSKFTISNMSVETGAKCGIFEFDKIIEDYLKTKESKDYFPVTADNDAEYEKEIEINTEKLVPLIAKPHSPANVVSVKKVEGKELTQVFIGSCTNGRLEDLKIVSEILNGKKVNSFLKVIVIPASIKVYNEALKQGYIQKIIAAGATVCNTCCGPCAGISHGLVSDNEIVLATSNRNFQGRMGSQKAEIYLASPATAAASAIEGKITDPRKYLHAPRKYLHNSK